MNTSARPTLATLRIEVNRLQGELMEERDKRVELEEIISVYEQVHDPDVERELHALQRARDMVRSLRASLIECQANHRNQMRELKYLRRVVKEARAREPTS